MSRTEGAFAIGNGASSLPAVGNVLELLSEDELEQLVAQSSNVRLESGEERSYPERYDGGLLLIRQGRVRVYKLTARGRQLTFALLGEGASFPIWGSPDLLIQAMKSSTVTYVRRQVLERLVRKKPEVGLRLVDLLTERLRQSEERVCDVVNKEVTARLASIILMLTEDEGVVTREGYKIPTHYTHEQLGTMIGANRVAVTTAFSALQDLGAVELKRRLISVLDVEALRRLASDEKALTRKRG